MMLLSSKLKVRPVFQARAKFTKILNYDALIVCSSVLHPLIWDQRLLLSLPAGPHEMAILVVSGRFQDKAKSCLASIDMFALNLIRVLC